MQHPAHEFDLVLIDRMAHPWVDALADRCTHALEDGGGFVDAFKRDVEIHVTASEEDGGAVQGAAEIPLRAGRADQPAAQAYDTAVACCVAYRILLHQAGSL